MEERASRREFSACIETVVLALLAWGAKAEAEAIRVAAIAIFMVIERVKRDSECEPSKLHGDGRVKERRKGTYEEVELERWRILTSVLIFL
jgi:hypothetical protein